MYVIFLFYIPENDHIFGRKAWEVVFKTAAAAAATIMMMMIIIIII
jgi:hypothetical protein